MYPCCKESLYLPKVKGGGLAKVGFLLFCSYIFLHLTDNEGTLEIFVRWYSRTQKYCCDPADSVPNPIYMFIIMECRQNGETMTQTHVHLGPFHLLIPQG